MLKDIICNCVLLLKLHISFINLRMHFVFKCAEHAFLHDLMVQFYSLKNKCHIYCFTFSDYDCSAFLYEERKYMTHSDKRYEQ